MRTFPKGLSVGHRLSRKEIEEAFDTGFGYQMSGIHSRWNEINGRYVLVFAKEEGTYDDSVKRGQFGYIGEGASEEREEMSPGNSVLIDAIGLTIPIHFFYMGREDPRWEYQGLIDVLRYDFEERNGQQVIVFSMEHRPAQPSKSENSGLYLIPVNNQWRSKFEESLASPVDLTQYENVPAQLEGFDTVRLWGTTETDGAGKKQAAIDQMEARDYCLFYHNGEFFAGGYVGRTFESPEFGGLLWDRTESRYIYTVEEYTTEVPSIDHVWDMLGYNGRRVVQGFTRVADDRIARLDPHSIEVLFGSGTRDPTEEEIEKERSRLIAGVEAEPQLVDDREQYTQSRRRARDSAFAELVKEAYNEACAVCRSTRETPEGTPEVEAAHIYPKSKGGSDDVRNGLALCRLHHWAFDSGWIVFTDDYEIMVREVPHRNGYQEFEQLDGDRLVLPDDERVRPHPMFFRHRRELNEFDD